MSTFLQVLRLVFWINPLQRALTCLGVILVVADSIVTLLYTNRLSLSLTGLIYALMVSLLTSGVYWRIASAPRIVRLAPHGRTRLLGSVAGLVLLIPLLWVLQNWLYFLLWVDPKYMPSMTGHLVELAGSVLMASVAAVGLFIASRSPFAALVVLVVVASPGIASTLFDVDLQRVLGPLPMVSALLALIWIPFSIWYLKARRISPPRWLASGGQDVLATAMVSWARPKSRREALERQLLGGTTVVWLALQWFVVLGLLLGLQWLLDRVGEPRDPKLVARVMYVSLCICPIVTTIVCFAAIRRSRALWLLATSSRVEFFASIDSILMRLNYLMALVHLSWLVALWFAFSWRHGPLLEQLDATQLNWLLLWVPEFFATNAQLARLPKWSSAIFAAGAMVVLWRLSATGERGNLLAVMLLVAAITATFVLRVLARHRWRDGDFPRKAIGQA
jgi:hypothetical protein